MARRTKLTPALSKRFCRQLADARFLIPTAALCGVPRTSVYDWLARGERDSSGLYHEFAMGVARTRAKIECDLLKQLLTGDREKWRAAAWLLDKLFPTRYGTARLDQREKARTSTLQRQKLEAEIALIQATLKGKMPAGTTFTLDPTEFDKLFQKRFGALPARAAEIEIAPDNDGDEPDG